MEYSQLYMYIVRVERAYKNLTYMEISVNMFTTSGWISHFQDVNPLTSHDAFWHCQILAACYQLVQSVLKIGSALAERMGQGEVGGCTALADMQCMAAVAAACRKALGQCQVGHLSAFLYKRAQKMLLSPCRDSISGILGSF